MEGQSTELEERVFDEYFPGDGTAIWGKDLVLQG
jgi:hypothetical protein